MNKSYNIGNAADMNRFQKDMQKTLMNKVNQGMSSKVIETACPHCKTQIAIVPGQSVCPNCQRLVKLTLDINL